MHDDLLRERAQSTARREALLRVARLTAQSDVGQLFEALLAEAVAVLHADDGGIARWDAARGVLRQAYTFLPSASAGAELDLERSASGRAASLRTATIINEYQREIGAATPAGRLGATAVVAVPLVYAGRLLGTLSVSRLRAGYPFELADAELLELLASTASATLVNLERNKELERAKEAAEAADRAKTAFLASMSHELRTPLNAILGYCDLLLEDAPPKLAPDLGRIQYAGRELLNLIDSVLELSEIESGVLRLRCARVDAAPLLHEALDAARPVLQQRATPLTLDLGSGLGEVWADPAYLRQALLNLLGEASKFAGQAGLRVEVTRERHDSEECLSVRVVGSGVQVTAERLGLGLALTSRLCALMGGALEAESQPGVGAVFTLSVPTECQPDH